MNNLKSQIMQAEQALDLNTIFLHQQYHEFVENENAGYLVLGAMAGGLAIGYVTGRYAKVKLKSLVTVPLAINSFIGSAHLFLEGIKKPR